MNPIDDNAANQAEPGFSAPPPTAEDAQTVFRIGVTEKGLVRPVLETVLWSSFVLILCDVVFVFMKFVGNASLRKVFSVERTDALANWFASLELLCAAGLTFFLGMVLSKTGQPKELVKKWWGLAAFLLVGAFDMGTGVHRVISGDLHAWADNQMVGASTVMQPFYNMIGVFQWQVVIFPLYLIGGFCAVDFLRKTVQDKRMMQFAHGAASCFAFAYIGDHLLSRWAGDNLNRVWRMPIDQARHLVELFQMAAKMAGGALILYFVAILLLNVTSVIAIRREEDTGAKGEGV